MHISHAIENISGNIRAELQIAMLQHYMPTVRAEPIFTEALNQEIGLKQKYTQDTSHRLYMTHDIFGWYPLW